MRRSVGRALYAAAVFLAAGAAEARAAEAKTLRIASKSFTESVILAEIATQLARSAGFDVEHRAGLGGSRLVWDALVNGSVDVYPEYTGTLIDEILPTAATGLAEALAAHGIGMTAPLGFNNTYAIGLPSARAQSLGITNISDLRAHPDLVFGFSNEFMSRRDGWPGLQRRYGLPQTKVQGLDHDLAYRGLRSGALDGTDVYTTDAEIRQFHVLPLTDDLRFFKRYDAVLLYRLDLDARVGPGAVKALRRLEGRIDEAAMVTLNARAKLERVPEADVAAAFVRDAFGVAAVGSGPSVARRILARIGEHLLLVGVSLLAAIFVAIPLGIAAAKRRRLGQVVLAVVGIVQTLPTLALLVFMIPLFGIGTVPAIVALFLYGLLPIVRNTHAGLSGIPSAIRESAAALGLPPGARLRLVELPLASPLILAGIKSAAVINVGTATLGALIGAGGLGQPIFTGIRLNDVGLILEGAIPASVLALAVQGLFELVERLVVPRGLHPTSVR